MIDCKTNRAYIPLAFFDPATDHGRVAVIDLSKDPNVTDPRMATVILNHTSIAKGAAVDQSTGIVFVPSGTSMDLIDEATNKTVNTTSFPFPPGAMAGIYGQVLFDPVRGVAITATQESGCPVAGTCKGFALFSEATRNFSSTIIPADYAETFAFNPKTNIVIDASDDNTSSGQIAVLDMTNKVQCLLTDANIRSDKDGASLDPATNIAVVSNEDGTASVLNLQGSTFSNSSAPCTVNEAGTTPNSVLVTGLDSQTAGSAVNPTTHEAFLISDDSDAVTLLALPPAPVTQIKSSDVGVTIAKLPGDPSGARWGTAGDPYAVAVGNCPNGGDFGYAVNASFTYLAQVDLKAFKANPSGINAALPAGNCAGTSTTLGCSNGQGVKFYPLPN